MARRLKYSSGDSPWPGPHQRFVVSPKSLTPPSGPRTGQESTTNNEGNGCYNDTSDQADPQAVVGGLTKKRDLLLETVELLRW